MNNDSSNTCATCRHIGVMYHTDGFRYDHMCGKTSERRAEGMPLGADFFAHFRAFFDAAAQQRACKHYEERPLADEKTLSLLSGMTVDNGRGEFRFFSDENRLAEKLDGMFVRSDMHARKSAPGNRVFWLLPIGKAEVSRAESAPPETKQ
jgi:hypothetical protein